MSDGNRLDGLHRTVSTTIAVASAAVAVLNAFSAPAALAAQGLVPVLLTPQVLGLAIAAAFAAIAAVTGRLRTVEVVMFMLVGLLSAATASHPQLDGLIYGAVGIALAAEYGHLRTRGTLKLSLWGSTYVLALLIPASRGTMGSWLNAAKTITAAVSMCLIVWAFVRARLRFYERREGELNALVDERTKDLNESLHVQSALLSEIHHRTKNNLQLVSSMLSFVERGAESTVPELVEAARGRILALARVHELLYNETSAGLTHLGVYLNEYVAELSGLFLSSKFSVQADIDVANDVPLDTAVRVSLIVNEIAMMAMERSAVDRTSPTLRLRAREETSVLHIDAEEHDQGAFEAGEFEATLGARIVAALVETLNGTWNVESIERFHWRITIPLDPTRSNDVVAAAGD